jgi:hypothetical protein
MKQETLEEAALLAYPIHLIWDEDERYDCSQELREAFIEGAKWQKDKQDEFAIEFAKWIRVCKLKGRPYNFENIKELLEIYKDEINL